MAKKKRTVRLIAFLKGSTDPAAGMPGCAKFNYHSGGCLLQNECLVQEGKRCGYFEKAVLPNKEWLYPKGEGMLKIAVRPEPTMRASGITKVKQ